MKRIILISFALLLLTCQDRKIEIIPNHDLEYNSVENPLLVSKPEYSADDEPNGSIRKFEVDSNLLALWYRIYINNENGEVAGVKVMHGDITQADLKNIKIMEGWKFKPFNFHNIYKKVRFDITLNREMFKAVQGSKDFDNIFFVAVEEMPSPIGGVVGIQKRIRYPEIAKRAGIQGRVFVKALIDTNGNVADAKVIKGIGGGCDEAAIEAVKQTTFIPGKQKGLLVNVQVTVPILFKLGSKSVSKIKKEDLYILKGFVTDNTTNEKLIAASIEIQGTNLGASTNHDGFYFITKIPKKEYTILVNCPGYKETTSIVSFGPKEELTLNFGLEPIK